MGTKLKKLSTKDKLKILKNRIKNYILRLVHPWYYFPFKLITYTLYYLIKLLVKLIKELFWVIIDTLLFPFRGFRNFLKSIFILLLIVYISASLLVITDYIENQYGWYAKFFCSAGVRERLKGSVVRVVGGYSEGSGFFISANKVLTNFHVIVGEPSPKIIFPDGRMERVINIKGDKEADVAVLYLENKHPEMPILKWTDPNTGLLEDEPLISAGYPGGTTLVGEATLMRGNFITLRNSKHYKVEYIQTDINVAKGMSGGPLVDSCGSVVGINTSSLTGNSFFISIKSFRDLEDNLTNDDVTKISIDPSTSPEEGVKAFYTYLKVRDMAAGYNLLSTEYLKNTNFEEWTSRFTDILDVQVIKIEKSNWPPSMVFVKFGTKNWVDNEMEIHYYEGTWDTVLENGVYKMLEANIVEIFEPDYKWFWES